MDKAADWKDVIEFEGYYQVNSDGQVRSLDRIVIYSSGSQRVHKGILLKPLLADNGYLRVCLQKEHKTVYKAIHRLVLQAFLGGLPFGYQVNHINGIKKDNRLDNLEYLTPSQNRKHAFDTNLQKPLLGSNHQNAKLTEENILEIRTLFGVMKQKDIATKFKVSRSTIADIQHGRTWITCI